MSYIFTNNATAKPFVKWAGGKGQLIGQLGAFLPEALESEPTVTYIEPFVGGGAMLFHMLNRYPRIERVIINDINSSLIGTYKTIRDYPEALIELLWGLENRFLPMSADEQKEFYLYIRSLYNGKKSEAISQSAYFIFLNRTCFNGLYRENSRGEFNVPFGRYVHPNICNAALVEAVSRALQKVEILEGDYTQVVSFINGYTFVYLDPPYRPLSETSSFNSYVSKGFDDREQERLSEFYYQLVGLGCDVMLSNSDSVDLRTGESFFEPLYKGSDIRRISARRNINSKGTGRGMVGELLIRNYPSATVLKALIS